MAKDSRISRLTNSCSRWLDRAVWLKEDHRRKEVGIIRHKIRWKLAMVWLEVRSEAAQMDRTIHLKVCIGRWVAQGSHLHNWLLTWIWWSNFTVRKEVFRLHQLILKVAAQVSDLEGRVVKAQECCRWAQLELTSMKEQNLFKSHLCANSKHKAASTKLWCQMEMHQLSRKRSRWEPIRLVTHSLIQTICRERAMH